MCLETRYISFPYGIDMRTDISHRMFGPHNEWILLMVPWILGAQKVLVLFSRVIHGSHKLLHPGF